MSLFYKRPLCLVLCVFLGGFVFFTYANTVARVLMLLAAFALLLSPILYKLCIGKTLDNTILCTVISAALLIASVLSFIYFDLWYFADKRFDGYVTVEAVVTDYEQGEFSDKYSVKTLNINNEPFSRYNLIFETERNLIYLNPGYKITFVARLDSLPEGNESYHIGKGLNAVATEVSDIEITERGTLPFSARLRDLRRRIAVHAIACSDPETGSLVSALIIGEKDMLSSRTKLDFSRIGISHVLALSGMHLAILSYGINLLLSRLRINKKVRTPFIIAFAFLYMLFTGFSVTIVRAGLMLIFSSSLFMLSRPRDSVTSLSLAVFLIIIFSPNCIFDVSLWLSAFATLGVILAAENTEALSEPDGIASKLKRLAVVSLLPSVFAVGATLFISAQSFGEISYIAPFSTVIFSLLIELVMYIGSFMLIFGKIIPIRIILAPICKFTTELASKLSELEFISGSVQNGPTEVIITLFVIVFFLFAIIRTKATYRYSGIISALLVLVISASLVSDIIYDGKESVIYYSDERYDALLVKSDNEAIAIVSATYDDKSAHQTAKSLDAEGVVFLDCCYLTHYSKDVPDFIELLLSRLKVTEIALRAPLNREELTILENATSVAEKHGALLSTVSNGEAVSIGKCAAYSLYSVPYGEGSASDAILVEVNGTQISYLASGSLEGDKSELLSGILPTTDYIIFGRHGRKYNEKHFFKAESETIQAIVFSSENVFITPDAKDFYEKSGCEILSHPQRYEIKLGKN